MDDIFNKPLCELIDRRTFLKMGGAAGLSAMLAALAIKPSLAETIITDNSIKVDTFWPTVSVETLAATKTLVVTDDIVQWLDPGGADRDVVLPAEASSTNLLFIILNTADGAGEDLLVKNAAAAVKATLGPGMSGVFSCDGTNWKYESDTGLYSDLVRGTSRGVVEQYYGVSWDEVANTYARTGALTGVAVGSSPGNALLPIQAAMRRCVLNDDGIVQYYLDPDNSYNRLGYDPEITGTDDAGTASKVSDAGVFALAAGESDNKFVGKYVHNLTDDTYAWITARDSNDVLSISSDIMDIGETFEICTAGIAYGGDGQVMVEVPLFYYRYGYLGTTHTHDISFVPLDGFSVHHDFVKNGEVVPNRYYGAYEGSMYDASAGAMVPPASIVTAYTMTSGDKLCSLSGQYPKTNETRAEFRLLAAMRGDGWRQLVFDDASAYQLLYLVEYASFQSQAMIGQGRTQLSGGSWVADSYIGQCGKSNLNGNGTGNVEGNTNAAYMSYRGIENIYGNVWKWLDGINVNEHLPYVCNNDSDFQDDTAEGYTALDVSLPAADNYQQTLFPQDRGFLPKTVGAATTQIGDYYYQAAAGWRVVRLGGHAIISESAGAFYLITNDDSASILTSISGRLCR
jgi:hypothetical protein